MGDGEFLRNMPQGGCLEVRDVQSEHDKRNVAIDKVGISGLSWPIQVLDRMNGTQETVANVSLSVFLPRDYRGTHMSRFIEVLGEQEDQVTFHNMENLLKMLQRRLDADEAHADFEFPYFITKKAREWSARPDEIRCALLRNSKKTSLTYNRTDCPYPDLVSRSKEISDNGAHNQRAHARIAARMKTVVWIEELAEIADKCASAPVYSILKREDEKAVTERAYANPRFVEDSVRELAIAMENDHRITWYSVSVTSHESIHNHDAFASIERSKA